METNKENKRIRAVCLHHRGADQVGLRFTYDPSIRAHLKKLEGVRWTKTHRCFYLEYTPENIRRLLNHCRGEVWVDLTGLRTPSATVTKAKTRTQQPVASQTTIHKERPLTSMMRLTAQQKGHLAQFETWMAQHRYSAQTIKNYINHLSQFFLYLDKTHIEEATAEDVVRFNHDIILKRRLSVSYQRVMTGAIKLFYSRTFKHHMAIDQLDRPIGEKRLPVVLSKEEISRILQQTANLKHMAILGLTYGCGLRRGEVLELKMTDLDPTRHLIRIRQGKGRKDRYVPYAGLLVDMINTYIEKFSPREYLFEGQHGGPYSARSMAKVLEQSVARAGILKRVTLHTLRHSFATHHLEAGTDIRYIQEILGHSSPKTTMIYTHVTTHKISEIRSPLDDLSF